MYVTTEKKMQLNIARLCCHSFLSLVVFWLRGARAPWPPPLGYAYARGWVWFGWTRGQVNVNNLLLFWYVSLGSNATESKSFFEISPRIFENKRMFFEKMYDKATLGKINQEKYNYNMSVMLLW